jgi:hypothetical protein
MAQVFGPVWIHVLPGLKRFLSNHGASMTRSRKKRFRFRPGRLLPPPARSARIYVRIDRAMVHMFRFLLEAQDNLGFMTVADRWGAVLQVRFSPHQEAEMRDFLQDMRQTLDFSIVEGVPQAPRPL